jgi:hypothetical protein
MQPYQIIRDLHELWNSQSNEVKAGIVAALASVIVSVLTQLWSPIAQFRLERKKLELQAELEALKANLQKDLERARDNIVAKNERLNALLAAKQRWRDSNRVPSIAKYYIHGGEVPQDEIEARMVGIAEYANDCRRIYDDIRYLLQSCNVDILNAKLSEISVDMRQIYETSLTDPGRIRLAISIMEKERQFADELGTIIDKEIADGSRSRLE